MRTTAGMGSLATQAGNFALALRIHRRKAALGRCFDFGLFTHDGLLLTS
jgi:hypothetical protein